MPLSFPSNPSVNQTSTQNGRVYRWSGAAWEFAGGGGSGLTWSSVPASATASGTAGDIAQDANFVYVCTEANYWKRSPLTDFSTTALMLHMDSSPVVDSSAYARTVTATSGFSISATQSKWGGYSGSFNGTSGALTVPWANTLNLNSGDFTIESWIYPTATNGIRTIVGAWDFTDKDPDVISFIFSVYDGQLGFFWAPYSNVAVAILAGSVSTNQWTHVAITRQGSTFRAFVGGSQVGTFSSADNPTGVPAFNIGAYDSASRNFFSGYMDDLRVLRYARNDGTTITVPTEAFPNS